MERHVLDGYKMLRDRFDFTAEIILWHHRFQQDGYPAALPPLLHDYCKETGSKIPLYGRILSIADCFDALHRANDKFGGGKPLSEREIKRRMRAQNPDLRPLIDKLYAAGVFSEPSGRSQNNGAGNRKKR